MPGRGKCQGAFYKVHTPGRGVLAGAALSFPAALQRRDPAVESGLPRSTRDVQSPVYVSPFYALTNVFFINIWDNLR